MGIIGRSCAMLRCHNGWTVSSILNEKKNNLVITIVLLVCVVLSDQWGSGHRSKYIQTPLHPSFGALASMVIYLRSRRLSDLSAPVVNVTFKRAKVSVRRHFGAKMRTIGDLLIEFTFLFISQNSISLIPYVMPQWNVSWYIRVRHNGLRVSCFRCALIHQ